jgi:SAM-dependent methyltransferase
LPSWSVQICEPLIECRCACVQEWFLLSEQQIAANGDPRQGWRYQKCRQAHRSGAIGWRANHDGIAAVPVPYSAEAAEAYTDRRFIPAYAHHMRVLSEVAGELGPSFAPKSVLDFGCGPGVGLAAAVQVWQSSVRDLIGVDSSPSMLAIADILLAPPNEGQQDDSSHCAGSGFARLRLKSTIASGLTSSADSAIDLAIVAGTLSELRTDVERAACIHSLWAGLAEGGVLVIFEHGGAIGGHVVRQTASFSSTCLLALLIAFAKIGGLGPPLYSHRTVQQKHWSRGSGSRRTHSAFAFSHHKSKHLMAILDTMRCASRTSCRPLNVR